MEVTNLAVPQCVALTCPRVARHSTWLPPPSVRFGVYLWLKSCVKAGGLFEAHATYKKWTDYADLKSVHKLDFLDVYAHLYIPKIHIFNLWQQEFTRQFFYWLFMHGFLFILYLWPHLNFLILHNLKVIVFGLYVNFYSLPLIAINKFQ